MAGDERAEFYGIPLQFVVPATPLLGYAYAFLFAWGRASYFHVPADLIDLDLTTVVQATLILVGFFLLALLFGGVSALFLARGSNSLPDWLNRFLRRFSVPFLVAVFYGLLSGILIPLDGWAMLGTLFIAASVAYAGTIAVNDSSEPSPRQQQVNAIVQRLRREHINVAFYVLLLGSVTFVAGATRAEHQETFKVNAAKQDQVLLAIYSHNVGVFGYLDKEHDLTGKLTVMTLDDPELVLAPKTFRNGIKISEDD